MIKKIAVFADTSISNNEIKDISPCNVDIFGSAKKGDILDCVINSYSHIVLIDGNFDWTPAVWHKEILIALEKGIQVIGGGSIGALRAVELKKFGMVGVGEVYSLYDKGIVDCDDEVAVVSIGDKRTIPLVNIRYSVDKIPSSVDKEVIFNKSKAVFYKERTWDVLNEALGERLFSLLKKNYVDIKNSDARLIFSRLDVITSDVIQPAIIDSRRLTMFEKHLIFSKVGASSCFSTKDIAETELKFSDYLRAKNLIRLLEDKYKRNEFQYYLEVIQRINNLQVSIKETYLVQSILDFRRLKGLINGENFKQWLQKRFLLYKNLREVFSDYILMLKITNPEY